jgi:hypothetical protein
MDCEVLLCPHTAGRGVAMLKALIEAAPAVGINCIVDTQYGARSKWLMTYGLGHPERRPWIEKHLASGGRLIGWDLGYWDREVAMRLTIDRDHPQHLLTDMPGNRFAADNITLREDYKSFGPIILAGNGAKTRQVLNDKAMRWEQQMLEAIRAAYPTQGIRYRAKRYETFSGLRLAQGTVEEALAGASLVVCRHSNIAVDACIAGVPAVCSDGIASALYGSSLTKVVHPSREQRLQFLQNVAWWQWRPTEAIDAWKQILRILN